MINNYYKVVIGHSLDVISIVNYYVIKCVSDAVWEMGGKYEGDVQTVCNKKKAECNDRRITDTKMPLLVACESLVDVEAASKGTEKDEWKACHYRVILKRGTHKISGTIGQLQQWLVFTSILNVTTDLVLLTVIKSGRYGLGSLFLNGIITLLLIAMKSHARLS